MASGQLSRASVGASRGLVFQRSLFIPQRYASASVSTRRAVQTATGQLSLSDTLRRQSASGYIRVRRASEHLASRAVLPPLLPSSLLTTMGDETTPFTPEQMAWLLPRLQPPSSSPAATADGTTPPPRSRAAPALLEATNHPLQLPPHPQPVSSSWLFRGGMAGRRCESGDQMPCCFHGRRPAGWGAVIWHPPPPSIEWHIRMRYPYV